MDIFVRHGDTIWHYSQLFQLNNQLIIDSNQDIELSQLVPGKRIRIPGFIAQDYQLKADDTLWGIAQSRNLSLEALYLVNSNLDPNNLQVGQMIKVPLRITWRLIQIRDNYDYTRLMNDICRLQGVYPFLQVSSIGKTVLEREIPEVLIGTGQKKVHYNGSFHANEWITTPVMMTFLNDYLLSLTNNSVLRGKTSFNLYQQCTLSIVPMVNPDGVDLVLNGPPPNTAWSNKVIQLNSGKSDFTGWKANIRGVDLNDQFPAKWELERLRNPKKPGPRDFGGETPLSEPEAIAMAELTRRRDFARVYAFHTQCEEIYWGFENQEPPESQVIVNELSRVSGYKPVKTIESYAGYKDWFIQEWRRPGFTIELGHGTNPLPITQFDEIYQKSLGIFLAGLYI